MELHLALLANAANAGAAPFGGDEGAVLKAAKEFRRALLAPSAGNVAAVVKAAVESRRVLSGGKEGPALKAKYERYKELYAKAFPGSKDKPPSLGDEPPPALKTLFAEMQKWKDKHEADGMSKAAEVSREVIAKSHDINVWGIPYVLSFSTQNGKFIELFIIGKSTGEPPPTYVPNPGTPTGPRPYHTPAYPPEPPQWRSIDPRSGHEVPRPTPDPLRPPGK